MPQGKLLVYEPSIRLPLLMRGPGVPAGERRSQLVTNADLAPTILDAAEATPGRAQDGRSLLDLALDPGAQWGRELLIEGGNNNGLTFRALRNYRWKYVQHANGELELYDLENDPDELTNVASSFALGAAALGAGGAARAPDHLHGLELPRQAGAEARRGRGAAAASWRRCAAPTPSWWSAWSCWSGAAPGAGRAPRRPASGAWHATPGRPSAARSAPPACCPAGASCCAPACGSRTAARSRST